MDESVGKKEIKASELLAQADAPLSPSPLKEHSEAAAAENNSRAEESPVLDFRDYAHQHATRAFRDIILVLVLKSRLGSVIHIKLLMALAGADDRHAPRSRRKAAEGLGLREQLMGEVERLRLEALRLADAAAAIEAEKQPGAAEQEVPEPEAKEPKAPESEVKERIQPEEGSERA